MGFKVPDLTLRDIWVGISAVLRVITPGRRTVRSMHDLSPAADTLATVAELNADTDLFSAPAGWVTPADHSPVDEAAWYDDDALMGERGLVG